jgi:hypothetical protein
MPLSISDRSTCPPSCAFFDAGCYFGYSFMRFHWGRVPTEGLTWNAFLAEVRALPPRTLWRHNEAGDLPGRGERIDLGKLAELVLANMGRRGWSFTHKTLITDAEVHAVARANRDGFTINLSADTLEEADARADLGAGPVVVVLPSGSPTRGLYTPAGRKVVVCPAQTHALTCADCQLCAVPTRKSIIAFRAHGQGAEGALETARGLFQLRRKPAEPARRTA